MIARSRAFCGGSLQGRITASAFGPPGVNLRVPTAVGHAGKQAACAATWDDSSGPAVVDVGDLADGLQTALAATPALLHRQAQRLAAAYRQGFAGLCAGLA